MFVTAVRLSTVGQSINQSINSLITEMSKRTSTCEKTQSSKMYVKSVNTYHYITF